MDPDQHLEGEVRVVADALHCMDWAVRCAVLRNHGQRAVEHVEVRMLASHQANHFLEGLRKLGLDKEASDAVRCAKYHCLSNALGGLRTGYAVEASDKAWLFYWTPYYLDSPWSPGVGLAAFEPRFLEVSMRTWHANNGTLLGNPDLGFAVTHLVMRGDIYDAGYFFEAKGGDRFRTEWGEQIPDGVEIRGPEFDAEWPLLRQIYAWRNFANGYVGGRLPWLVEELGLENAAKAVEHGFRIALLQKREGLLLGLGATPGNDISSLFHQFHRASGCDVRVDSDDHGASNVVISRSRLHEAAESGGGLPMEIEIAIESAWRSVFKAIDPDRKVTVLASPGRGDPSWVWRFN